MVVIYKFLLLLLPFLAFVDATCEPSLIDTKRSEWLTWLPWTRPVYDYGLAMYAEPNCTGLIYYKTGMTQLKSPASRRLRAGPCEHATLKTNERAVSLVAYTKSNEAMTCQIRFFNTPVCTDVVGYTRPNPKGFQNQWLGPANTTLKRPAEDEFYLMVHELKVGFASYQAECEEKVQ